MLCEGTWRVCVRSRWSVLGIARAGGMNNAGKGMGVKEVVGRLGLE